MRYWTRPVWCALSPSGGGRRSRPGRSPSPSPKRSGRCHRPPTPRPDRGPARGRRGAGQCPAAQPRAGLADCADAGADAGGRPRHRAVPLAPDLRRRRRGAVGRRASPRRASRSDEHTRYHLRRRQGRHPRPPPALLRLLRQPQRGAPRAEPALRGDAVRRRRHRGRHALFSWQSGRRGVHAHQHQHRRRRAHESPGEHDPPARRRQGNHRGVVARPHGGGGGQPAVALRGGHRGPGG